MIKIIRNILIHSDQFDKPKGFEYEKHYLEHHNSQLQ